MRKPMALAAGLVLFLVGAQIWAAGDDAKGNSSKTATAGEIARLIERLGGETAAGRAAAQKALEKIGKPALKALQLATTDKDAERAERARAALRQIEETAQRKRIREADERVTALLRRWAEAGKTGPAADANEIRRLIKQLGATTAAERDAAQEALVKMGLPATEALVAATKDANRERAAQAKDALARMAIRKEDWPVHWRDMTFSYRSLSPDPNQCRAVRIDARRRAVFIYWHPVAGAFAKAEWTVPQDELDMLQGSLGKSQPWVPSESSFEARQADNARVELVITLGDRFARFCEPLPLGNPPEGSRIASIYTLDKILSLQAMARKRRAIRGQADAAAKAARGGGKIQPGQVVVFGEKEALAQAKKLIAEARRTGKPLPTGDKQELYGSSRAGAIDAWTKAGEAQAEYEKTYGPVGKKIPKGKADPNTPAGRAAFAKVEKLYLDAIERLGVNDYGASAERYLADAYRYVGRKDKFEQWRKQAKQTELLAAKLKELARSRREGGDWPELAALMRLLHNPGNVTREDLAAPLSKLGKRSDEAVVKMTEEMWAPGNLRYRWHVIWALAVMDTPASRKALLKLALDGGHKHNRGQTRSAAREYLKLQKDKAGAKCLLVAPDSDVVIQALMHLRGEPIDKEMFDRLVKLMRTGDREIRFQIVQNFGQDPGGQFVAEKVAAIVKAIPEIAGMPEAEKMASPVNWTKAELRYRLYADALSRLTNPPEPIEKALAAAKEGGATWRCLVLAYGLAGDAKAWPGLRKILTDAKAGMFRVWACEALGRIASAEDLPLLRETAAKDPMQRKRGGCRRPMNGELFHPVREAAGRAIKLIEEGKGAPTRGKGS